ncbi:PilN domain-containing protein [Kineococcus sp. GCM10028916]|uniref:PilN domain-containing protein n=1 Tax=Kineococcus sp. GCM10028916 TaxID=3273394 RepID=UPI0036D2A143
MRQRVVRVNLLPTEFADSRRIRRIRFMLGAGLVVVLGACGAAAVISGQHVDAAQSALSAEQARTTSLQAEQNTYAEVPEVQTALATAQRVKKTIQANDVAWYSYLDKVASDTPDGVALTTVSFGLADTSTSGTDTTSSNPLAVTGVGTGTFTGQATSLNLVSDWLDQMAEVPGFAGVTLSNNAQDPVSGVMTFNATVALTADALTSSQ